MGLGPTKRGRGRKQNTAGKGLDTIVCLGCNIVFARHRLIENVGLAVTSAWFSPIFWFPPDSDPHVPCFYKLWMSRISCCIDELPGTWVLTLVRQDGERQPAEGARPIVCMSFIENPRNVKADLSTK